MRDGRSRETLPIITPNTDLSCKRILMPVALKQLSRYIKPRSSSLWNHSSATQPLFYSSASGENAVKNEAKTPERGAMSRRLEQMTEESIESAGRAGKKLVQDAVFDENVRKQLEQRIAQASVRLDVQQSGSATETRTGTAGLTHRPAGAQSRTSPETVGDTTSPVLPDDAGRSPRASRHLTQRVAPIPKGRVSSGSRIAYAKERSSVYSNVKDSGMSPEEREAYFREIKARFQPNAREVPATLRGLASLANERIENAIARGQFKNLPRGKALERDYNASSPWIDTTEYFMNKMIQKQDIVPPWIEKQQEVMSAVRRFRARLRNDWKRHATRVIASEGGRLEEQMRRAEEYAAAEAAQSSLNDISTTASSRSSATVLHTDTPQSENKPPASKGRIQLFRDPDWEAAELSFLKLAVENLNSMTRSYNLMAPEVSRRPYLNLSRELKSCFADVAPLLREELRLRAITPTAVKTNFLGTASAGVLHRFDASKAIVHDEDIRKKGYGFRQFWNDIWRREANG
jgi:hypothetical protein